MAIERKGVQAVSADATPAAISITIPGGTTLIVLMDNGYGSQNQALSAANLNGSESFTVGPKTASGGGLAAAAYLFTSTSGSATLNLTYPGVEYTHSVLLAYYSGVSDAGLRDTDAAQDTSLTLTTQSGDWVVAGASGESDGSWTNATERTYSDLYYGYYASLGDMVADGTSETVSWSGGSSPAMAALVLVAAGGGGKATKNTRSFPLGVAAGMHRGMGGWH